MDSPLVLTAGQFSIVYNAFSFVIASMGAAVIFFLLARNRVRPANQLAVTISTVVVSIALYHYLRIFGSWEDAFSYVDGSYVQDGAPFNEAYRYVDWLLTVPLLLTELVIVLKLAKATTRSLLVRLTIAAVAMIVLGYPGEISAVGSAERTLYGIASTIPFLYILYVLFVELGRSLGRQPAGVRTLVDGLRYIILVTWAVYPLAYLSPSLITDPAQAEVVRQVGYSIADVLAKPLFGLLVLAIAIAKSTEHDSEAGGDTTLTTLDSRLAVDRT
ncbi:MAG: bacteriorhodopsin-like [Cellulomonas sp.]